VLFEIAYVLHQKLCYTKGGNANLSFNFKLLQRICFTQLMPQSVSSLLQKKKSPHTIVC